MRAGGLRPLMVPPLWMMLPLLVARSRWLGGSGRTLCPVGCWGWCLPSSRGKDCAHPRPAISCDGPLDAQYWWELLPLLPISKPTWRLYGVRDSPFILHLEGSESGTNYLTCSLEILLKDTAESNWIRKAEYIINPRSFMGAIRITLFQKYNMTFRKIS